MKISDENADTLKQLWKEGKSVLDIARMFYIPIPLVWEALKELKLL